VRSICLEIAHALPPYIRRMRRASCVPSQQMNLSISLFDIAVTTFSPILPEPPRSGLFHHSFRARSHPRFFLPSMQEPGETRKIKKHLMKMADPR
jgi:hypothetical protein